MIWQFRSIRKCSLRAFIRQQKSETLRLPRRSAENNTCFIMAMATCVQIWTKGVGNSSICRRKKSKLGTMLFPLIQFLLLTGSSSPKRSKSRRTWGRYKRSDKLYFLTVRYLILCVLHAFAALFTKFTSKLGSLSRICLITLLSFSESSW